MSSGGSSDGNDGTWRGYAGLGEDGASLAALLDSRGYCTFSIEALSSTAHTALQEVHRLHEDHYFKPSPMEVVQGFLGQQGATRMAELDEVKAHEYEGLYQIDTILFEVVQELSAYLLEGEAYTHASTVLVESTDPAVPAIGALTESQASKWQYIFLNQRLAVVAFLGPSAGTAELQWHNSDGVDGDDVVEVETSAGSVLIYRPHLLACIHFTPATAVALQSFFCKGAGASSRLQSMPSIDDSSSRQLPPSLRLLDDWIGSRMVELKEQSLSRRATPLPKVWHRAINRSIYSGQPLIVAGLSLRVGPSLKVSSFSSSLPAAADLVFQVPSTRWDHERYYSDDVVAWQQGKTYSRHMGCIEGLDLFDNRTFALSILEAKSMDPQQRLLLEDALAGVIDSGCSKASLKGALVSVYVGMGMSDWGVLEHPEVDRRPVLLSMAPAFHANRISFCLGLKGPSVTTDCEGASAGVAMYLAAESLTRKRGQTGLPIRLAIAASARVSLTCRTWPMLCSSHSMSRLGRCFVFDKGADGFVFADCSGSLCLRPFTENVEGVRRRTQYADQECHGLIVGSCMRSNGPSAANLYSSSGVAERAVVAECLRNARLEAVDTDVVETCSTGGLLPCAAEVASLASQHPAEQRHEVEAPPLALLAQRSSAGHAVEASAMLSAIAVLKAGSFGILLPSLHLRQLNPYIDSSGDMMLQTEVLELQASSSFGGFLAKGIGGTLVHHLVRTHVHQEGFSPHDPQTLD